MFHTPNQFRLKHHKILGSDDSYGNNGFFIFQWEGYKIHCQASDGMEWEHVSVTINRNRTPTWEIMCHVKNMFWDVEDSVIQFHPPGSVYVNRNENCLHLWRSTKQIIQLPESIQI